MGLMPTSPRKACPAPGCPELVVRGYCPDHKNMGYQRDDAAKDRAKVYASPRWRGLRRRIMREQPWCAVIGCNNLATDLDHIMPLRVILETGGDPYARVGLQPLCAKHHGEKTRQEQYGFKA